MGSAAGTGFMSRASRAPGSVPSHVYRPTYQSDPYSSQRAGLDLTPQASMYSPNYFAMPTYTRPSAPVMPVQSTGGLFSMRPQTAYRIPMAPVQRPSVDPNLVAINQAFARQTAYDSDGNSYTPTRYMDEAQRNAILQNPGSYLDYARYVQGGGDPAQFQRTAQPIRMMTAAQQQNLAKSQAAELGKILPAAAPVDSGGGG